MEEKWGQMTIFQQLGNIASELSRAIVWEKKNNEINRNNSLERVLELASLTLADKKNSGIREIARFQELVADSYCGGKTYGIPLEDLYNYLLPFAIRARSN